MQPTSLIWTATVAVIITLLVVDFVFHARRPHIPTIKEAAWWSAAYVGLAILFGFGVLLVAGKQAGEEYFAGYLTEKALSVDNLFVFLVIMSSFAVPRPYQQKVLLFGIAFSLVARTGLIFVGASLVNSFAWTFYLFGTVLLVSAVNLLRRRTTDAHREPTIVRWVRRVIPTTPGYDGNRLLTRVEDRRMLTPMVLVIVAVAATDVLFAVDSIPAIYGLTQNVYLVFTATAFSLLGLRQLYFLIDGLLDRLIYLAKGLAAVLAFIGVRLVLHALHENTLPFINNGQPVPVPDIDTGSALLTIILILAVTVIASLLHPTGAQRATPARDQDEHRPEDQHRRVDDGAPSHR
ncbi:TerC family protein [Arthrobacter sp. NamB2]|uniref:TerC family protein n=1 Tax=Arthrobacter sp. NamB2 TaxID=2576035 RepID=UPI0010C97F35|nr:TerC family protein [Arthrobacter sp. NamB2]TKV27400.1 TerC family protein [Arthrobacter sp. NamB2]